MEQCSVCEKPSKTLVRYQERRLCPSCLKNEPFNLPILEPLQHSPDKQRMLDELYPGIPGSPRTLCCCACKDQVENGVIVRGMTFCLACAWESRPKEMADLLKKLGLDGPKE